VFRGAEKHGFLFAATCGTLLVELNHAAAAGGPEHNAGAIRRPDRSTVHDCPEGKTGQAAAREIAQPDGGIACPRVCKRYGQPFLVRRKPEIRVVTLRADGTKLLATAVKPDQAAGLQSGAGISQRTRA
jgi:hypothetical protein